MKDTKQNGKAVEAVAPAPIPEQMGTFQRQLPRPERVGEISAAEAREIKALNELLERLQRDMQHAQRLVNVTAMHRGEFLRSLIVARGLNLGDQFNIDDDSGTIFRTHELVEPTQLQVVTEPEPETVEA